MGVGVPLAMKRHGQQAPVRVGKSWALAPNNPSPFDNVDKLDTLDSLARSVEFVDIVVMGMARLL